MTDAQGLADQERPKAGAIEEEIALDARAVFQHERGNVAALPVEFQVEKEDVVYPMVPAGSDLHAMIRRPKPSVLAENGTEVQW